MIQKMTPWSDPKEMSAHQFWKRARRPILRALKRQLELERKTTEGLLERFFAAMNTEMEFRDQRIADQLEQIDTSLSLIASEIARHADDPSSGGA